MVKDKDYKRWGCHIRRKFGGRVYKLWTWNNKKLSATKEVKKLKPGYSYRIVYFKGNKRFSAAYATYIRKK